MWKSQCKKTTGSLKKFPLITKNNKIHNTSPLLTQIEALHIGKIAIYQHHKGGLTQRSKKALIAAREN